jgi:putative transposase
VGYDARGYGARHVLGIDILIIPGSVPSTEILQRFGTGLSESRKAYEDFVREGLIMGQRPDLTGGGLIRSCGGWRELHSAKEAGVFLQSDERILGDSDFVAQALKAAEDDLEKKSRFHRENVDLEKVILAVGSILGMEPAEVCAVGKQPRHVRARSLLCYWAVREIGVTEKALAKY